MACSPLAGGGANSKRRRKCNSIISNSPLVFIYISSNKPIAVRVILWREQWQRAMSCGVESTLSRHSFSPHEYSFAFFVHQVVIADVPGMTKIYYYILHKLHIAWMFGRAHSSRFKFMLWLSLWVRSQTALRCCLYVEINKWKIVSPFHRHRPFNPSLTIFGQNLFSFRQMPSYTKTIRTFTVSFVLSSVDFRVHSTPNFICFLLHPIFAWYQKK